MMAYADRLERFTRWYVQLWAESLGKDGKGTTPVAALGPVDQHSQLQLFIAGPRDKLITVITTGAAGRGPRMAADLAGARRRAGLRRQDHRRPRRRARAAPPPRRWPRTAARCARSTSSALDEASLGELLMHFMLETIIAARSARRRSVRPAGGRGGQGAGEAVSRRRISGYVAGRHDPHYRHRISIGEDELEERFIRASGPGGQNVNKLSTAVQLRFDVRRSPNAARRRADAARAPRRQAADREGVLVIIAQRHRTQERNRQDALDRLVELIERAAVRAGPAPADQADQGSRERRLETKKRRSSIKGLRQDKPAME